MKKFLNVFAFIIMIVMNYLANALPINGMTTGELSDNYPNLFVPTGLTFSIWGIIYLLLAICCVLQFFPQFNKYEEKTGWWFVLSSVLNSFWIITWHYQMLLLSMLIMIGLLFSLIAINKQLISQPLSILKAAFGIYLGWICIATIANATAFLVHIDWNGWGINDQTWAIVLICIGLVITSITTLRFRNPFIGLAVAWAFLGIAIKRSSDYRAIYLAAIFAAVISVAVLIYAFFQKNYSRKTTLS